MKIVICFCIYCCWDLFGEFLYYFCYVCDLLVGIVFVVVDNECYLFIVKFVVSMYFEVIYIVVFKVGLFEVCNVVIEVVLVLGVDVLVYIDDDDLFVFDWLKVLVVY